MEWYKWLLLGVMVIGGLELIVIGVSKKSQLKQGLLYIVGVGIIYTMGMIAGLTLFGN